MDVAALGELLIDFTENGISSQGNPLFEGKSGRDTMQCPGNVNEVGTQNGFYWKSRKRFFGKAIGRCN